MKLKLMWSNSVTFGLNEHR